MDNIIYSYTRQEAVEDGVLVMADDQLCKEAGFRIPVALTASVQAICEAFDGKDGQSYKGRLWDTLFVAMNNFKRVLRKKGEEEARLVAFTVGYWDGKKTAVEKLWIVFNEHEGFTIMKPEDY